MLLPPQCIKLLPSYLSHSVSLQAASNSLGKAASSRFGQAFDEGMTIRSSRRATEGRCRQDFSETASSMQASASECTPSYILHPAPSALVSCAGGIRHPELRDAFVYNGHLAVDCLPCDTTEAEFEEVKEVRGGRRSSFERISAGAA